MHRHFALALICAQWQCLLERILAAASAGSTLVPCISPDMCRFITMSTQAPGVHAMPVCGKRVHVEVEMNCTMDMNGTKYSCQQWNHHSADCRCRQGHERYESVDC